MSSSPFAPPANAAGVLPPRPPFELANRVGALQPGRWEEHFDQLGAGLRSAIERRLPADWTWEGKIVLDFGSGAGRALRHFWDLVPETQFWGCDIHAESIAWLNEHLAPMRGVVCGHEPGLPLPDDSVDLVYATSVFTHLTDHWAGWLLELPDEIHEIVEAVPALIEENQDLAARVVELNQLLDAAQAQLAQHA